ncbi:DMT family transporter [Aliidiomarina sp. Y6]|nr:DMT family transporter [Aliidiomarina quisquiliarum]
MKQLATDLSSYQISFFRGATSLPFVLGWILVSKNLSRLKATRIDLHLLRGLISIGFLITTVLTLRELPLANAYALFFAAPLAITLLSAIVLKEPVGRYRFGAVIVGFIGVLVMLNPKAMGFASIGVIAGLLSMMGYSCSMILVRFLHRTETSESLMFYFILSLTIGCGLLSFLSWKPVTMEHAPWLLMLGISGAIGQYLLTEAYRKAPPSLLSSFEYTAMIWAIGLGYIFWNELPSIWVVVGSAIVISSGIYISHRETVRKAPITTKVRHKNY